MVFLFLYRFITCYNISAIHGSEFGHVELTRNAREPTGSIRRGRKEIRESTPNRWIDGSIDGSDMWKREFFSSLGWRLRRRSTTDVGVGCLCARGEDARGRRASLDVEQSLFF